MTEPTPEPDLAPPGPNTRRRIVVATLIAAGGVAAGVAIGATTSASAAGTGSGSTAAPPSGSQSAPANCGPGMGKPGPGDFDGTISSVGSSTITVRDPNGGSRTYAITAKTTAHNGPGKTIAVGKLAKGEHVHVRGAKSGTSYSATDIDVVPARPKGAPGRHGNAPGGPGGPGHGAPPKGAPKGAPKPPQASSSSTSS